MDPIIIGIVTAAGGLGAGIVIGMFRGNALREKLRADLRKANDSANAHDHLADDLRKELRTVDDRVIVLRDEKRDLIRKLGRAEGEIARLRPLADLGERRKAALDKDNAAKRARRAARSPLNGQNSGAAAAAK